MFSRKIVDSTIDRWIRTGHFKPEYHTIADCERAVAHFNSLVEYDPETDKMVAKRDHSKRLEDTLTAEEVQWMRNERFLCRADFIYWLERYVYIKNEEDHTVRMALWISQKIFLDIVSEMQDERIAIMLIVLKARQLGLSRVISLILLHLTIFFPNRNAFIASSTEQKTGLLFDMVDFVLERLPWWMRPNEKFRREGKLLELHNGSGITLQHGQQTTGIARGTTPTAAHLSELAEFEDASSLVDSALLRAMHDSPEAFLVLEGTAEGMNNWWHKKWNASKAGWPERRSRLRPLFLPWFVGALYPKPDWLRAHPVPPDYTSRMMQFAYNHAAMAEEYVKSTDYLRKRLGSNWQMPLEQIWYYELERDAAQRENRLNKFQQEMPANDDEAFQATNVSVFDTEVIVYYRDNAHRQPLVGCYGLRGPAEYLPQRLQPSELLVDSTKPIIPITADWGVGPPIHFELVPVRFDGWSLEDESTSHGKIFLWEKPMPGETYGFGVDTGDGVEKDSTVIEILKKGNAYHPMKQVGEMASSRMNALDVTPFALALGTYFSVPDEHGTIKQPRMAIECKGTGDQTQLRLKMHGWRNFHLWVDKQIDDRKIDFKRVHKIGVFTNFYFRTGMMEMIVKSLRDGELEVCSPHFVKEMQSLQADDIHQSLRAEYGGHDDRIMALGFILISMYRFDVSFSQSAHIKAYAGYHGPQIGDRPKQYARWALSAAERA